MSENWPPPEPLPPPQPLPPPSAPAVTPPPPPPESSLQAYMADWVVRVRSGDLGSLPIVIGIVAIAAYFQYRDSDFLTAGNFVNLIAQMAAITVIGMGVVFILLLGEIDLSIGFVSGIGGVVAATLLLPDSMGHLGWPTFAALAVAIGAGVAIGLLQGSFVALIGVPSFVVTLAGLLAWNGVVLNVVGSEGTIVIQDKYVNGLANQYLAPWVSWTVLILTLVGYGVQQLLTVRQRQKAGLPNQPWAIIALRVGAAAVAGVFVVWWADTDRGIPYVGLVMLGLYLFWTFITLRTRFGRHVYAVGGNAEAARRAGIPVAQIRIIVFMISGGMAATGGIILASRLNSVDTSTGGGTVLLYSIAAAVIGGVSLFGGRGRISGAVLGALVISMIDNGLGLLNITAGTKYIITGAVLLAAVTLDSVSRRRSAAVGR
jgi:D-xylose transport system permease protein